MVEGNLHIVFWWHLSSENSSTKHPKQQAGSKHQMCLDQSHSKEFCFWLLSSLPHVAMETLTIDPPKNGSKDWLTSKSAMALTKGLDLITGSDKSLCHWFLSSDIWSYWWVNMQMMQMIQSSRIEIRNVETLFWYSVSMNDVESNVIVSQCTHRRGPMISSFNSLNTNVK